METPTRAQNSAEEGQPEEAENERVPHRSSISILKSHSRRWESLILLKKEKMRCKVVRRGSRAARMLAQLSIQPLQTAGGEAKTTVAQKAQLEIGWAGA